MEGLKLNENFIRLNKYFGEKLKESRLKHNPPLSQEELAEEIEENYEENDFACSEDEWETKNKKGITITREDLLEEIIIEVIEMEVE